MFSHLNGHDGADKDSDKLCHTNQLINAVLLEDADVTSGFWTGGALSPTCKASLDVVTGNRRDFLPSLSQRAGLVCQVLGFGTGSLLILPLVLGLLVSDRRRPTSPNI